MNINHTLRASLAFAVECCRFNRDNGYALFAFSDAKLILSYANKTKDRNIISLAMRNLNQCRAAAIRNNPFKVFAA